MPAWWKKKLVGMDSVQMRDGAFIMGTVRNKSFLLASTASAKPLKLKASSIAWITFHNAYGYPNDEVQMRSATLLTGDIIDEQIQLRLDDGLDIELPVAKALNIHFGGHF